MLQGWNWCRSLSRLSGFVSDFPSPAALPFFPVGLVIAVFTGAVTSGVPSSAAGLSLPSRLSAAQSRVATVSEQPIPRALTLAVRWPAAFLPGPGLAVLRGPTSIPRFGAEALGVHLPNMSGGRFRFTAYPLPGGDGGRAPRICAAGPRRHPAASPGSPHPRRSIQTPGSPPPA